MTDFQRRIATDLKNEVLSITESLGEQAQHISVAKLVADLVGDIVAEVCIDLDIDVGCPSVTFDRD